MIGDEIGQIKTFLDIGVVFLGKPPNFGQIYGLIPKNGNFDADQPCFWTWLNPFGGLIGERSVRPLRFFPLSPSFFFFLPSLSFIFLLAHILARPFILTLARACPFPLPPGDHPLSADFAVCAFADAEACALRAGLFFISFSRSFFSPGPACVPSGSARASPQMPGARDLRLSWRAARCGSSRAGLAIRPASCELGWPARFDRLGTSLRCLRRSFFAGVSLFTRLLFSPLPSPERACRLLSVQAIARRAAGFAFGLGGLAQGAERRLDPLC